LCSGCKISLSESILSTLISINVECFPHWPV